MDNSQKRYRIWSLKGFRKQEIVEDNLTWEQVQEMCRHNGKYAYCHAWEEIK